jgi:hypothetical protein
MNSMGFISVFNPKIIFQSWVDSLKIFLPGNLIRFLSETFKRFLEGIKVFFSGAFWVGILCLIISLILDKIMVESRSWNELTYLVAFLSLFLGSTYIFQFGWLISILSSVDKKDFAYLKKYLRSFPAMLFMGIIVFSFVLYLKSFFQPSYTIRTITIENLVLFMFVMWISLFFFVESRRSFKGFFQSFLQMLMFFIFNLPGLMVFMLSVWALLKQNPGLPFLLTKLDTPTSLLQLSACMIFICILYTYFIQRVNANKKLYS